MLSGGEQAKVRFCLLMNRENNVLVLDEPTNHLDVDAKDELKRALKGTRDRFSWFATSQISMKAGWTKSGTLMN